MNKLMVLAAVVLFAFGCATTAAVPAAPVTPEIPAKPAMPDVPKTPAVPEAPKTPEAPKAPDTPKAPGTPVSLNGAMIQDINSNNNPEASETAAAGEERYPGVSIKNTVKEEHYSRLLHKSASETEAMLGAASTPSGTSTTATNDYGDSNDFNTAKGALKKQAAAKAAAVVNPRDDALPAPQVSGGSSGSEAKSGYATGVAIPNTAQKEAMAKIATKTGAAVNPRDDSAGSGSSSGRGLMNGVAVPNPVQKDVKNRNLVRTKGYGQWR